MEPAPVALPASLAWLETFDAGRAWLADLPSLVARAADRWLLRLGDPYPGCYVSLVLPAKLADGNEAVLKVQFPHPESEHEAAALAHWDGDGAVRLLAHDPDDAALLIERCSPGTHLSAASGVDPLAVLIGLLPRLWKPAAAPFTSLADEAERWAAGLRARWERAGRPFEASLVDDAVETLRSLADTQGEQVLLHQDLHPDNVLHAQREPWLVIDPKPLIGERAFGVAPVVRAYELGHSREQVLHRLDRLCADLGLDRERARGWAFGQTLAWAFEGDRALPRHVETARWLREAS